MKSSIKHIDHLWSEATEESLFFELWKIHLEWLQLCGWKDARKIKHPDMPHRGSQHRTVDRLRKFISATGLVNAHFGLTSSDIEDNVRLRIICETEIIIIRALKELVVGFNFFENETGETAAFTHWQPAGVVSVEVKSRSALAPLAILLNTAPPIRAKKFGGPCGDNAELNLLRNSVPNWQEVPFNWARFGLERPINENPIQSSDHLDEMHFVVWCAMIAAQLHKLAADLRFMISIGILTEDHPPGYRGSSSIPRKSNPYLLEKVCSIMRTLSVAPVEMWQVMAHNGCERTLDTSWQIRHLLSRISHDLVYGIECFKDVQLSPAYNNYHIHAVRKARNATHERLEMASRVLMGEDRLSVYEDLHRDLTKTDDLTDLKSSPV